MSQLPMGLGIVAQVQYPFIQPLLQQLLTYNSQEMKKLKLKCQCMACEPKESKEQVVELQAIN